MRVEIELALAKPEFGIGRQGDDRFERHIFRAAPRDRRAEQHRAIVLHAGQERAQVQRFHMPGTGFQRLVLAIVIAPAIHEEVDDRHIGTCAEVDYERRVVMPARIGRFAGTDAELPPDEMMPAPLGRFTPATRNIAWPRTSQPFLRRGGSRSATVKIIGIVGGGGHKSGQPRLRHGDIQSAHIE